MSSEGRDLRDAGMGMLHECNPPQNDIVEQSGWLVMFGEGASKCNQVACMLLQIGRG